jgi:glycosyltransferase involved in cell wall biosynthesis
MLIGHYMQGISDRGGIATYIRRLSKAQIAAGHRVYYLDTRPFDPTKYEVLDGAIIVNDDNDLFAQAKAYKLDILHLHAPVSIVPPKFIPTIRTVHNHHPYCPSGTRHLQRWNEPCDRAYSLGGCLWGHLVDYCGSIRPQRFYPGFQRTWEEMQVLGKVLAIANSHFVKNQMIQSGYPAHNIHVLHLPAPEIQDYLPPEQEDIPHFLFLGRITPEKGLSWLLKAITQVKTSIKIDIAGAGNQVQEKTIINLAQQLNLMNKVTFHGWTDETKTLKLIQQARALIFPSVWHEPAGFVSLEAAALGRPIIVSKVGGIPEYAEVLNNALFVEPNDVGKLAENIDKLATNWSLSQKMGLLGRNMAKEHFLLENHVQNLIELYELALNRIDN